MQFLIHKGYHLHENNYYIGVQLFRSLHAEKHRSMWHHEEKWKEFPPSGETASTARHIMFYQQEKLLAVKFTDWKDINMLTVHLPREHSGCN